MGLPGDFLGRQMGLPHLVIHFLHNLPRLPGVPRTTADHAAILTVLRSLGRETRDDTWYLFDIPPAVAERLSGVLDGSPYEATVDSLHGTVRIEYNGAP